MNLRILLTILPLAFCCTRIYTLPHKSWVRSSELICSHNLGLAQVVAEENYDGPDMTYYFDEAEKPPHGPDDGGDDDDEHVKAVRKSGAAWWSKLKGMY